MDKTCYHNIFSTVINNGFSSGWFSIYRGVRQGCSLSCILFVLAIEIMATLIRKNQQITGITIDNCIRKLVQFADDTTCILNNVNSIEHLFCTLKYFGQFSGQKLNMEKSVLYWVGPWKQKLVPQNISVTIETGSINVLGVIIGNDNNKNIKENFRVKLASMRNNLNMWKFRNLTLIGKITLSKSIGMSNLIYSMSMVETPQSIINESQTTVNKFNLGKFPTKS